MASRSAKCPWCGTTFHGWGDTAQEAQNNANAEAAHHAMGCPSNPANQE